MKNAAESSADKPKNPVEDAANKTVDETKKALEKLPGGDTHGAYNKLIESVRTTHSDLDKKDKTGKSAKEYEQTVVKKLEQEKLLPTFALEYGQRAFDKIDHKSADTKQGDGRVTVAELKAFQATGKTGEFGKSMTDSLIKQSESISKNSDQVVAVSVSGQPDSIATKANGFSRMDLANGVLGHEQEQETAKSNLKKAEETRVVQSEAKQLQSYLFDGKDGKPSIFAQADFVGSSDMTARTDGKVGKADFEALAADPRLSADEKKDINDKIISKWDSPDFQKLYLDNGQMSAETFKRATGEEQEAAAAKAKQDREAKQREEEEAAKRDKAEAMSLNELLNKKVGNATILDAADFAGSDRQESRTDKLVNKKDLQALISSPDFDKELGDQIRTQFIDKMDDANFKNKYMKDDEYIDIEKVSKVNKAPAAEDLEDDKKWEDIAESAKKADQQRKIDAEAQAIIKEKEESALLAQALTAADGSASLLQRADYVGSSDRTSRTDGLVTKGDLTALAADPSLAAEQRDFINKNLLGDKWDTPAVKRLRNGDYISLESLNSLLPSS